MLHTKNNIVSLRRLARCHDDPGPVQKITRTGQNIVRAEEPFVGLYLVRSGFFKSFHVDTQGEIQITGFYFPGELFGFEGVESGRYHDNVVALDTGSLCRLSLGSLLASEPVPASQRHGPDADIVPLYTLLRIMSGAISRERSMLYGLGKLCARRRFAAFLLDVSQRMESSGYHADVFRLCMSRIDMANYLCLAIETISRLFTQFRELGVIAVEKREVTILDREELQSILTGDTPSSNEFGKVG